MPDQREPEPTEFVYLIGSSKVPLVKIGRTIDVDRRLAGIQGMSPVPLEVLWLHPGGRELESTLHRCFGQFRSHGEWFDFGEEDPVRCVQEAVETGAWVPQARKSGEVDAIYADTWWQYIERVTNGATQTAIAAVTGVDKVTVWRWKADKSSPSPDAAIRLARAYGRPVLEALVASGAITREEARVTQVIVKRPPDARRFHDAELVEELRRRMRDPSVLPVEDV